MHIYLIEGYSHSFHCLRFTRRQKMQPVTLIGVYSEIQLARPMHGCTSLTPLSAIAFDLVRYNVLTDTANVCNLQPEKHNDVHCNVKLTSITYKTFDVLQTSIPIVRTTKLEINSVWGSDCCYCQVNYNFYQII